MNDRVREFCRSINGWLWPQEGQLLFSLAKNVKPGQAIIELGSYEGRSTACLAEGSLQGEKAVVYAVDPHTGSPEHRKALGAVDTFTTFQRNIERFQLTSVVKPCRMTSVRAAKELVTDPIGLLFIDAQHEYAAVRQDVDIWLPRVADQGVIVVHDTFHSDYLGPWHVCVALLLRSPHIVRPRMVRTIVYFQKTETSNSLADRLTNAGFVIVHTLLGVPYYLYWLVKAPLRMLGIIRSRVNYN